MDKQIVISLRTIFLTFLVGIAAYVVYRLGPIFGTLLVALFLVIALESLVKYFMRMTFWNKPVSRNMSVVISYFLFLISLTFILVVVVPPVVVQSRSLFTNLSQILQDLQIPGASELTLTDLIPPTSSISNGVVTITVSLFSNIAAVIGVFFLSIYMSFDWSNLKKRVLELLPDTVADEVHDALNEIEVNVGHWVRGELFLMVSVGLMSYIGYKILGVKLAMALAIIAGLLEIVPMIGPLMTAVIAAIIGFSDSTVIGFGTIIVAFVVQQAENNLLVPKIMEKVSGFSPLAILIALLVGGEFFGLLGVVLAVPVMMVLGVILKRVLRYNA